MAFPLLRLAPLGSRHNPSLPSASLFYRLQSTNSKLNETSTTVESNSSIAGPSRLPGSNVHHGFLESSPQSPIVERKSASISDSPSQHEHRQSELIFTAELQDRIKSLRASLTNRRHQLGQEADRQMTVLGLKINKVTGYSEVERLKLKVAKKEDDLKILREAAKATKEAYDEAVTTRSTAQRDVNSLLERKHSWTDSDVSRFTQLVRADHSSNMAVTTTAAQLKQAEMAVDKGFSDLMQAILERYHEEQVWSDKIRSVSTWGGLVALAANIVVFVGAIAFIEPWKRRRLVQGLEERVTEMMNRVEGSVIALSGQVEAIDGHLVAAVPPLSSIEPTSPTVPSETSDLHFMSSRHNQGPLITAILPWPPLDMMRQPSVERDLAAVGICGVIGGLAMAAFGYLIMSSLRR